MMHVVEILPQIRKRIYTFYLVNIMAAGVLAMQGARASAAMILTQLNGDNSVPAH